MQAVSFDPATDDAGYFGSPRHCGAHRRGCLLRGRIGYCPTSLSSIEVIRVYRNGDVRSPKSCNGPLPREPLLQQFWRASGLCQSSTAKSVVRATPRLAIQATLVHDIAGISVSA